MEHDMAWDGLMMLRRAPPVETCGCGCGCGPMAAPREGVMSTRQKEKQSRMPPCCMNRTD